MGRVAHVPSDAMQQGIGAVPMTMQVKTSCTACKSIVWTRLEAVSCLCIFPLLSCFLRRALICCALRSTASCLARSSLSSLICDLTLSLACLSANASALLGLMSSPPCVQNKQMIATAKSALNS